MMHPTLSLAHACTPACSVSAFIFFLSVKISVRESVTTFRSSATKEALSGVFAVVCPLPSVFSSGFGGVAADRSYCSHGRTYLCGD